MKYKSIFEIIGPVMVGPSSSHTAGALEIALYTREKFGRQPKHVEITLYNSFAKTYKGHGTDVALVGGLLGFATDDLRIPDALQLAVEAEMDVWFVMSDDMADHPNTVKLVLSDERGQVVVVGESIGGGSFKIVPNRGDDDV